MTFDLERIPLIAALLLVGCGENTKLIGTGASLTTTPCDQCAADAKPKCAGTVACFKRTDGTCGWASQCTGGMPQNDAGTSPLPAPPDAAVACPDRICATIACPYGNKKDDNGCMTCECNPAPMGPTCPAIACPAIACPYGNDKDANGCPTCKCSPEPSPGCAAVQCPTGSRCELREVTCVRAPCNPVPMCVPETTTNPCAATLCPAGTVCRAKPVVCVAAPCNPVAECVPQVSCGGFAGKPCPGSGSCQDDPTDTCDPKAGGADCIGMCVCKQPAECPPDRVWDSSPAVCACVKVPAGEPCGKVTCGDGEFCCNKSCSVCAPKGGACDQMACAP